MYIEKAICNADAKLMIHHESLKKLKHRLRIICQIHCTPSLYTHSVVEVVRRKDFSRSFINVSHIDQEEKSEF